MHVPLLGVALVGGASPPAEARGEETRGSSEQSWLKWSPCRESWVCAEWWQSEVVHSGSESEHPATEGQEVTREYCRVFAEYLQSIAEHCRVFAEYCRVFADYLHSIAEYCRVFAKYCRVFAEYCRVVGSLNRNAVCSVLFIQGILWY